MTKAILVTAGVVLLAVHPAAAQETGQAETRKAREEARKEGAETRKEARGTAAEGRAEAAGRTEIGDELLRAIRLPRATENARETGVPDGEIRDVLKHARARALPASEAQLVIEEETRAVKDKGPIDNFGAFVNSKLDEGLRGRALAEAIHAEHAARGKGRGHVDAKGKNKERADKGHAGERHAGEAAEARGHRPGRKDGMEPEKAGSESEAAPGAERGKNRKPGEKRGPQRKDDAAPSGDRGD